MRAVAPRSSSPVDPVEPTGPTEPVSGEPRPEEADGGAGCTVAPGPSPRWGWLLGALGLVSLFARRRR
jgi:MYXO-CTERM domain-containing protein